MRLLIGIVPVRKDDGRPHTGAEYFAGAKAYSSEARARSALREPYDKDCTDEYWYLPAYVELPISNQHTACGFQKCDICGKFDCDGHIGEGFQ